MIKLLVTGANGQLGNEIRVLSQQYPQVLFFFTDVDTLDITDINAVEEFVVTNEISHIINCAAYTAVDKAEDDEATATLVNVDAVRNLATVSANHKIKFLNVSTDYVFDGTSFVPYTEDMPVCPTNVYGRTKLAGEQEIEKIYPDSITIRTSWLYSSFGNNFVKTMLNLGRSRDQLGVIFDQVGTPTYAADLADAILTIVSQREWVSGIYHFSNEGVCSWYDFTKTIHEIAEISCNVEPIESSAYAVRTPRPHYSVLNKSKIKSTFDIKIPYWVDSLRRCISILEAK
ncbi:MAG: dTDP-4-dehydrorhamnose reductase [bacterium]